MTELAKRLDLQTEKKWQKFWEEGKFFEFDEHDKTRPVYTLDTPPPFTSGNLHMGHVLSYSYFDFVARYKRMKGFNVYYPQGWDCQGFPTETKVEKKYGRKPPEEFRKLCIEWTGECISKMKSQMRSMGFSADWKYEYKTMEPSYHKKVQLSALKMFESGQIYRAQHPVFWCTKCHSALAKTDTEDIDRNTHLHEIKFELRAKGSKNSDLIIATTRPELMHACVAVLYNPQDSRYNSLKEASAITALGKEVPFLADADVDREFGTGVVMACTFGDKQDIVWMYRHKLDYVQAMDEYGKLTNAGDFSGLKIAEAKEKMLEKFKKEGKLLSSKPLAQSIKVHDRCKTPVEYANSFQWFAKITEKKDEIKAAARKMKWHPEFAIAHLDNWADFVEWDWVISRQRTFGTPIPFFVCTQCNEAIAADEKELPIYPATKTKKCPKCAGEAKGELSVFDCWVDSSITPLIISRWEEDEKFFKKTYPANLRPQGVEIIRTWAFYTIYRCSELTGKVPFSELLLNGSVLAPDGKKMSKSLGNIIEPDKLIAESGADAVRVWAALSGAMAKDRPFFVQDIKYAKSFLHKMLNAAKFSQTALEGYKHSGQPPKSLREIDKYFLLRLNEIVASSNSHWENYEFHHIMHSVQEFFWHEFCDYYLEYAKERIYGKDKEAKEAAQFTIHTILSNCILLLTPFTPHACEELWQIFASKEGSTVMFEPYPKERKEFAYENSREGGKLLEALVSKIRQEKASRKLALNFEIEKLELTLPEAEQKIFGKIREEFISVCNIRGLEEKSGEQIKAGW
ncbi:MAG: valine--tRNA ligase [Candidatus Micrarchaeota archaeon]